MSISPQPYNSFRVADPPGHPTPVPDDPAPLGAQGGQETLRPAPLSPRQHSPDDSLNRIEPAPKSTGPKLDLPRTGDDPDADDAARFPSLKKPLARIPKIEPDDVAPRSNVELTVAAPSRKQVGSAATYRVSLLNTSDQALEEVAVHCKFDDKLIFPGSDKHEVHQTLGRLLPNESKELVLSLVSHEVGSRCCWFTAKARSGEESKELTAKEVCIEFVTRQLEIDLLGPTQRTEGSRAEFTVQLANRSIKTLTNVRAVISYDKALVPKEATTGAEQKTGTLTWNFSSIKPMESIQLQVEFECRTPARRACVLLDAKAAELAGEKEEACLEVIPVPGTLDLRVADRTDPLEVGQRGEYEVTVQNIGLQPARLVGIEAVVPESMKVLSAKVMQGDQELPIRYQRTDQTLTFDAVDQLAPNALLRYVVEVEALQAGPADFRASLTSALSKVSFTASEPTNVIEL